MTTEAEMGGKSTSDVGRLVEEKLENLHLFRALAAAEIDRSAHAALPTTLADLTRYDMSLTRVLSRFERGRHESLVDAGVHIRRAVFQALPARLQLRVTGALTQVAASEREVWLEVAALRRSEGEAQGAGHTPPDALVQKGVQALHEMSDAPASSEPRITRSDVRSELQDAKSLPIEPRAVAWLNHLPIEWLRVTARLHDLDDALEKEPLVHTLAAHLEDPDAVGNVLRDKLDANERVLVAGLVVAEEVDVRDLDEETQATLSVPWDWSASLPAGPGRLRTFGLTFVGMRGGRRIVGLPPSLHQPLAQALIPLLREQAETVPSDLFKDLDVVAEGSRSAVWF